MIERNERCGYEYRLLWKRCWFFFPFIHCRLCLLYITSRGSWASMYLRFLLFASLWVSSLCLTEWSSFIFSLSLQVYFYLAFTWYEYCTLSYLLYVYSIHIVLTRTRKNSWLFPLLWLDKAHYLFRIIHDSFYVYQWMQII